MSPPQCLYDALVSNSRVPACFCGARSAHGWRLQLHGESLRVSLEAQTTCSRVLIFCIQTYTMFDQVFWRATSGQVNRWRKNTLKIRATNLEAMQQHKIPFLYNFSPVVVPPPLDWRENVHVTGYWWLDNPDDSKAKKWEPPQDLLDWMEEAKSKNKKVVFVGFGSIIIPDPLEMTRVVVESAEKAGVYAIVAKGWSDRQKGDEGEDSEEAKKKREQSEEKHRKLMDKPFIFPVKSIPHDWLFPRIAAAVHHGGAGTTGASLRGTSRSFFPS